MRVDRNARRRIAYHLRAAMLDVVGKQVEWGKDDCVLLQADVHVAAGLPDPVRPFRNTWNSEHGARARVQHLGGLLGALRAAARRRHWRRVDPAKALIGDVGICAWEGGITTVTKLHGNEWVGRSAQGYAVVPTAAVRLAWAVTR